MSIGVGIFLMVVGAILAFAVRDTWDAVDLTVVGYILMLAGLAGIVLSFYITNRRRRVPRRRDRSGDRRGVPGGRGAPPRHQGVGVS